MKKATKRLIGERIYRLPSLSKCLQNEILPKNSAMIRQICELATTNQCFLRSHFNEFLKKQASPAKIHLNSSQVLHSSELRDLMPENLGLPFSNSPRSQRYFGLKIDNTSKNAKKPIQSQNLLS